MLDKRIRINSALIALLIGINFISSSINSFIPLNGAIPLLSVLIFLISLKTNSFKVNKKYLFFIFFLSYPIFLSLLYDGINNYQLGFILNAVFVGYVVTNKFCFKLVSYYIYTIFAIFIFIPLTFEKSHYSYGDLMGWSYSALPFFLGSYYFLPDAIKGKKIFYYSIYVIYLFWIIKFISRGAILAGLFFLFINILAQFNKFKLKERLLIIIGFILILITILNFEILVENLYIVLTKHNIKIVFVKKLSYLLEHKDLTNGRMALYKKSIEQFMINPLFGNRIGALSRVQNLDYEHNFILQLLNEGGITYFLIHLLIIIKGVVYFSKKKLSNDKSKLLLLLFCISIVKLLFSSVYWLEQNYWMYLILSII